MADTNNVAKTVDSSAPYRPKSTQNASATETVEQNSFYKIPSKKFAPPRTIPARDELFGSKTVTHVDAASFKSKKSGDDDPPTTPPSPFSLEVLNRRLRPRSLKLFPLCDKLQVEKYYNPNQPPDLPVTKILGHALLFCQKIHYLLNELDDSPPKVAELPSIVDEITQAVNIYNVFVIEINEAAGELTIGAESIQQGQLLPVLSGREKSLNIRHAYVASLCSRLDLALPLMEQMYNIKRWASLPAKPTADSKNICILDGTAGAGKSTQASQYIADCCGFGHYVIVTQPRSVAAISLAERVSFEFCGDDIPLGYTVGYVASGKRKLNLRSNKIIFFTEHALLQAIRNPVWRQIHIESGRVFAVVVDEAHERTVQCDILLGVMKNLALQGKIRLVISSATLDSDLFRNYIPNDRCFFASVPGRTFPITITYRPEGETTRTNFVQKSVEAVISVLADPPLLGSPDSTASSNRVEKFADCSSSNDHDYKTEKILPASSSFAPSKNHVIVFLPAAEHVEEAVELFNKLAEDAINMQQANKKRKNKKNLINVAQIEEEEDVESELESCLRKITSQERWDHIEPIAISGRQSAEEQKKVFDNSNENQKIIFATSIAETSLTIDGVVYVIDSGFARVQRYDHSRNVTENLIVPISQSSANQRSGRAGRTRPGHTIRLYSENEYKKFPAGNDCALLAAPLHSATLNVADLAQFMNLAHSGMKTFDWIDKPSMCSIDQTLSELVLHKAIEPPSSNSFSSDARIVFTDFGKFFRDLPCVNDIKTAKFLFLSYVNSNTKRMPELFNAATAVVALIENAPSLFFYPRGKADEADEAHKNLAIKFQVEKYGDLAVLLGVYTTLFAPSCTLPDASTVSSHGSDNDGDVDDENVDDEYFEDDSTSPAALDRAAYCEANFLQLRSVYKTRSAHFLLFRAATRSLEALSAQKLALNGTESQFRTIDVPPLPTIDPSSSPSKAKLIRLLSRMLALSFPNEDSQTFVQCAMPLPRSGLIHRGSQGQEDQAFDGLESMEAMMIQLKRKCTEQEDVRPEVQESLQEMEHESKGESTDGEQSPIEEEEVNPITLHRYSFPEFDTNGIDDEVILPVSNRKSAKAERPKNNDYRPMSSVALSDESPSTMLGFPAETSSKNFDTEVNSEETDRQQIQDVAVPSGLVAEKNIEESDATSSPTSPLNRLRVLVNDLASRFKNGVDASKISDKTIGILIENEIDDEAALLDLTTEDFDKMKIPVGSQKQLTNLLKAIEAAKLCPEAQRNLAKIKSEFPHFAISPDQIVFDASGTIDSGTFGTVFRGELNGGLQCAVKLFTKAATIGIEEAHHYTALKLHSNITKLLGISVNREDGRILIILELADSNFFERLFSSIGHSFSTSYDPSFSSSTSSPPQVRSIPTNVTSSQSVLPLAKIRSFARDIAAGLAHLHSNRIVHCDLKPNNILVFRSTTANGEEKETLKLTDFGGVVRTKDSKTTFKTNVIGTRYYLPPEYLLAADEKTKRPVKSSFDVFSFGIILLQMLAGECYFKVLQKKIQQNIQAFVKGDDAFVVDGTCCVDFQNDVECDSEEIKNEGKDLLELCKKCLMMNKEERPQNGGEILEKLQSLETQ